MMKMTETMMNALIESKIGSEWGFGEMKRIYINLEKADKLYAENSESLKGNYLPLFRGEKRNGKVWIDMETGEMDMKYISTDADYLFSELMDLFTLLFPEETENEENENEEAEENTEEAENKEDDMMTINPRAAEIAETLRAADTWDMDSLAELCELADMTEAWEAADGDSFESVAYAAAEKLGVEII